MKYVISAALNSKLYVAVDVEEWTGVWGSVNNQSDMFSNKNVK